MSSLKIGLKIIQPADVKIKLKIEIENSPRSGSCPPSEIAQSNISELCDASLPAINYVQAEAPELARQSGSFWRKLLSRLQFWRRN